MEFEITQCISARMGRLKRKIDTIYRKHLAPVGITESQSAMLLALHEKGEMPQIELSRLLNLEKSSLSRNLNRLEQEGYVYREAKYHPIIGLSPKGRHLVKVLLPAWNLAMTEVSELIGPAGWQALSDFENQLS